MIIPLASPMDSPLKQGDLERDILNILRNNLNLQTLLLEIAHLVGEAFQANACLIVAGVGLDASVQTSLWCKRHCSNLRPETQGQLLSHPFLEQIATGTELLAVTDLQSTKICSAVGWSWELLPISALLGIATQYRSVNNGMIIIGHSKPYEWKQSEKDALTRISEIVAIAISQVQKEQQEEKLYDTLHQLFLKEQQLQQLKSDFIRIIDHELRTPLTIKRMAIRILSQSDLFSERIPPEKISHYLQVLEQQNNRQVDVIENLLRFQWLESGQYSLQRQKLNLNDILNELIHDFEQKWDSKFLTLRVDTATPLDTQITVPFLQSDLNQINIFKHILDELLNNAGKFSLPHSEIILKLEQQEANDTQQIALSLTNQGEHIPLEEQAYIFEPFYRGKSIIDNATISGTGLGLALVKKLVKMLKGTIEVSSHLLDNSQTAKISVTLTVPQLSTLD